MDTGLLLSRLNLAFYLLAAGAVFGSLIFKSRRWGWGGLALAAAGWIAHAGLLWERARQVGGVPLEDYKDVLSWLCFAAIGVTLAATIRTRLVLLGALIFPLVLVLMFISNTLPSGVVPVSDDLERALLDFHVLIAVLGAAALFVTFAASILYLLQERRLKRKRAGSQVGIRLPSLEKCESMANLSLMWGFPLLTLTIITGGIWTTNFKPESGLWERQESFALLAWILLGVILAARFLRGWHGRSAAYLTLVAFTALLLRMIGVVL
jgi:ABC-type uncharacterized transport system permease subunit